MELAATHYLVDIIKVKKMTNKTIELLKQIKQAVVPMPGGQPPTDPAAQGAPPVAGGNIASDALGAPMQDPAMAGGPTVDPAMAGGGMPDPAMMEQLLGGMGGEMTPEGESVTLPKDVFMHLIDSLSTGKNQEAEIQTKKKKSGDDVSKKLDTILQSLGIQMPTEEF